MKGRVQHPKDHCSENTTALSKRPGRAWSSQYFRTSERNNNREEFSRICIHHLDQVQRFLIRHPEAFERAFPNFHKYVGHRKSCSPYFSHRWESLWRQRVRWAHKPSVRMEKYPVTRMRGHKSEQVEVPSKERLRGLAEALQSARTMPSIPLRVSPRKDFQIGQTIPGKSNQSDRLDDPSKTNATPDTRKEATNRSKVGVEMMGPGQKDRVRLKGATDIPFDPGGKDSTRRSNNWEWDPTPPNLKSPLPRLGDALPDAPIRLHPDLAASLARKALTRWERPFSMVAQAGRSRRIGQDPRYKGIPFGVTNRGCGEASLVIPAAGRVE